MGGRAFAQIITNLAAIKVKHASLLRAMARDVNLVWNYCNDLSYRHTQKTGKFFSAYDLQTYTAGATKEGLLIRSQSVQMVGAELVTRRKQFRKKKLAWRVSRGARRSLGWVPLNQQSISFVNGQIKYAGRLFSLWDYYGLGQYQFKSGNFSEDARGRWYFNVVVDVDTPKNTARQAIGIDLVLTRTEN